MDNAGDVVPNRAFGYRRPPGSSGFVKLAKRNELGTGGAGIRSTIGDMLRWQDALLARRIISLESVKAMTTPANKNDRPFGVVVSESNGHVVFNTGGGGPGFTSTVKIFPDDRLGFVVLTNGGQPRGPPPGGEGRSPKQGPDVSKQEPRPSGSPGRMDRLPTPASELEQALTQIIIERL